MATIFKALSYSIHEQSKSARFLIAITVLLLIGLCASMVYLTGGTRLSYLHFMYTPIIIAGFYFGITSGVLAGTIAGIIIGPLMPENVQEHIFQGSETWTFRTLFFALVGILSGSASRLSRAYYRTLELRLLIDSVTGLPNYNGISQQLKEITSFKGAIVIRFKQFRDVAKAFGPNMLIAVIKELRDRLQVYLQAGHKLARLSEDTFLIIQQDDIDPLHFARTLSHSVDCNFKADQVPFQIECIFAVAKTSDFPQETPLEDFLRAGLVAADLADQNNQTFVDFNDQTQDQSHRNIFILHELSKALENDDLTLHYQPIIQAQEESKVLGFEALARWNHSTLGAISPIEFISIAEQTHLINPYTKWLIKKALHQLSLWHIAGFPITLSLNFSMKNFQDPSVLENIFKTLAYYDLPPNSLKIEVTETAIAENIKHTSDILHFLREKRIKIAIDDFGTGQSSLKYLMDLPADVLKIDRAFVSTMLTNSGAEAIIRSAITLGHELNLKVIAEGIEEEKELLHLRKLKCDYVQGYFIARPMPADMATNWLGERKGKIAPLV